METIKQRTLSAARVARYAGGFAAGFLLAGARIVGVPIPAAVCLIAATPPGAVPLLTLLGAAVSCLCFWETETAVLTVAAGFLALTANWALRDTPVTRKALYAPLTATAAGAISSILLLLSGAVSAQSMTAFIVRMLTLPFGTVAAQRLREKPRGVPLCLAAAAMISGSGGIELPGGVPLGGVLAGGFCLYAAAGELAVPMAALGGLALDWSRLGGASAVPVLVAAALAAGLPSRKWQRAVAFVAASFAAVALSGGRDGALFLSLALGAVIALPLPERERELLPPAKKRLADTAAALDELRLQLDGGAVQTEGLPAAELFERAASKVCVRCARCSQCWHREHDATCEMLLRAEPAIRARGEALSDDLSPEFAASCRHLDAFLQAIDEGLSADAALRRTARCRRETRDVCRAQLRIASTLVRAADDPAPRVRVRYRAETACRGSGVSDSSGDRTATATWGGWFYLILCDGMGTGAAAAADSRRAVTLLSRLLTAGAEPDDALELLNGLSILREDGGSATVDLAAVDLESGDGVLYKWGGAPSYLKEGASVRKIGTASLPPGVGVGGTQRPQQFRLSLGEGAALILTSDGIGGEDTARLLRKTADASVRELAAAILACGSVPWEDDRTAAVLRLRPIPTR